MARTIHEQEPQKYNDALAQALKNIPELSAPEWVALVKSGTSRERIPADADFWYKRIASILRQLYLNGVVGVGKLRTRYGGKKNRGGRRSKFFKSSGKLIRVILQKCEAAGLVEKVDHLQFGRRLTEKGRDLLDSIKVEHDEAVPQMVEEKIEAPAEEVTEATEEKESEEENAQAEEEPAKEKE